MEDDGVDELRLKKRDEGEQTASTHQIQPGGEE